MPTGEHLDSLILLPSYSSITVFLFVQVVNQGHLYDSNIGFVLSTDVNELAKLVVVSHLIHSSGKPPPCISSELYLIVSKSI